MIARVYHVALVFGILFALGAPAWAGTTGGLRGRVVDAASGAGIAGAVVTATSPSQSASTQTDQNGGFNFLSLAPDSYVVSAQRPGFDPFSQSGLSVFADQVQNVGNFTLAKTLRVIGGATTRGASSNLVRPGTTSDVYSINAAGAAAAAGVGGPGGINQAYSAIATVPGANVPQGQQGWNQLVYIRGGDYSDVANELDGIPVQRASDYAPITTLSSLGQQEVQTYTGGTPASAEASGLSGFINQVIKTGVYPGYENVSIGVGGPAFYHKLSVEASGATNNRNFTYYIGIGAENQDYRYSDQFNGASNALFFYPLAISTGLNGQVYDGSGPSFF
ncbi:MAG: TonB-dependent receptor [Candidatus Eremiobacteraeota bacterium]|nr:TonB-dependent receptor [Candidatus Eremiobacteraeota bacterium]